jgi:hypothetical protein
MIWLCATFALSNTAALQSVFSFCAYVDDTYGNACLLFVICYRFIFQVGASDCKGAKRQMGTLCFPVL